MATKTDYNTLAQAFLRLWQDQMHRQMTDPEAIKTMLAAMRSMSGGDHDTPRNPTHAPDASDDAIRTLGTRLVRVERQLERLAQKLDALATQTQKSDRGKRTPDARRVAKPSRTKRTATKKPVRGKSKARKKR